MIPEATFYFWVFIIGSAWIVLTAFKYGEARVAARNVKLQEVYKRLGVQDIEQS